MEIVKSSKLSINESAIVDSAIKAVFQAQNQQVDSYFPNVSYFISNDPSEHPNLIVNINALEGSPLSKMKELNRIFAHIFPGSFIEPRYILAAYENPAIEPIIQHAPVEPVVENSITEKVEELKKEVTQLETEVADPAIKINTDLNIESEGSHIN